MAAFHCQGVSDADCSCRSCPRRRLHRHRQPRAAKDLCPRTPGRSGAGPRFLRLRPALDLRHHPRRLRNRLRGRGGLQRLHLQRPRQFLLPQIRDHPAGALSGRGVGLDPPCRGGRRRPRRDPCGGDGIPEPRRFRQGAVAGGGPCRAPCDRHRDSRRVAGRGGRCAPFRQHTQCHAPDGRGDQPDRRGGPLGRLRRSGAVDRAARQQRAPRPCQRCRRRCDQRGAAHRQPGDPRHRARHTRPRLRGREPGPRHDPRAARRPDASAARRYRRST